MSKAEEFAIKKYPVSIEDIHGHKVDVNLWQRKACVDGYRQAEKDNELTWEDISIIREILCGIVNYPLMTDKEVCTEVLNRFKKQRCRD